MRWNRWIRQIHRWLSVAFTVTVLANFVALARGGGTPPPWVTYSPLLPLAVLLFSGLYLFALPYAARRRGGEGRMKQPGEGQSRSASERISQRIAELGDWRGETLARMRALIREADPGVVEEWKWMGTPVWSHDGIICTGESYKSVVKLTFARGASLEDPDRLFNASLDGNARRAVDIREGETVDAAAFKALVRRAVALNGAGKPKASKKAKA